VYFETKAKKDIPPPVDLLNTEEERRTSIFSASHSSEVAKPLNTVINLKDRRRLQQRSARIYMLIQSRRRDKHQLTACRFETEAEKNMPHPQLHFEQREREEAIKSLHNVFEKGYLRHWRQ
jgi:hypothetical protein